ncbi:MAG: D-alanine--D-alanine ligase [Clostridia bacterium]|nr:D-alanine--D-alanine ligase [Clostridia bacterium]
MKDDTRKTALIIFGGMGYEHSVSVRSAELVLKEIDRERFNPLPVYVTEGGDWLIPREGDVPLSKIVGAKAPLATSAPAQYRGEGGLICGGGFIRVDVAFSLIHGNLGEDGVISGCLENAKIPYVGCDTVASAVTADKAYTKILAKSIGIPTARFTVSSGKKEEAVLEAEGALSYPMFVKPARLGSSYGAGAAATRDELMCRYGIARSLDSRVLIEEKLDILCELEVAYLSAFGKELFTSPGKICYGGGFYDYDSKYSSESDASVSENSELSPDTENTLIEYSKSLARLIGLRDLSRIDFFLTRDGNIYFNEINTIPGFTDSSLYPRLLSKHGIEPSELISLLLSEAMRRA